MDYDVIVVGGGPAGVVGAVTSKKYYPDKKVLLIKSVGTGVVPCGIPYMFSSLDCPDDNALGDKPLESNGVDLAVEEVKYIDKENRSISTHDNSYVYDKLILATGSKPIIPDIDGIHKKGIYPVYKEMNHLKSLKHDIHSSDDVVIIGGGFIGIEFADEIANIEGKNITLVEMQPNILLNSFDNDFSEPVREELERKGVKILTGEEVVQFKGGERVESVVLSDGTEIPCQVAILGIGAHPNCDLADEAGLQMGKGILVDEYLRTSEPGIFAVGDCSEKKDFFTRKRIPVMLASTACAEARIAGSNLYGIKVIRENKGTIATYSTKVGDMTLGSAGLTEKTARDEGFDVVVGHARSADKHPGKMPGTKMIDLKLIFSRRSEVLLGGQVSGGESVGEMINIIGMALQKNCTITELETLQVATHPKLTAPPTAYPLIMASQDALTKINEGDV